MDNYSLMIGYFFTFQNLCYNPKIFNKVKINNENAIVNGSGMKMALVSFQISITVFF